MTSERNAEREKKRLAKTVLLFNAFVMTALSLVGFIYLEQVADYLGDKEIAIIVLASLLLISISEIIAAKILFSETDRR